jgi:hypothetical protein
MFDGFDLDGDCDRCRFLDEVSAFVVELCVASAEAAEAEVAAADFAGCDSSFVFISL